jgi:asparagine synthase (glutamine-hydrolysing)
MGDPSMRAATLHIHPSAEQAPFFAARVTRDGIGVRGDSTRAFGHKIARPDGSIDGIYAEWHWDGRTLKVTNDRYGCCPLYYFHREGEFAISPSVARLVAEGAGSELDEAGVAVALRLGQFIGDDTPFRHIRCLPPNATLTWDGALQLTGGYRFREPLRNVLRRDAMDAYRDLFRASMARRRPAGPNFAVPLSGGRDSRHILFELCQTGFKPGVCITALQYPDDVRVAGMVSRELGIEHAVLDQERDLFQLELRKNHVTNFGFDEGTWPLLLADFFKERGIDTVYDGIAGDVLSAGLFLTPELHELFGSRDVARIAAELLPDNEQLLAVLLAPEMLRRVPRALALERMTSEVARHLDVHNPATSYFFWNRTRRKIAQSPYGMLAGPFTVYAPYLDHDLFDFLAALPAELIMDHHFHTEVIQTAYPGWAHLPFEDKTQPGHDFSAQHAQFARRFSEFVGLRPRSSWIRQPSFSARLLASRVSRSFARTSNWYLRPALWLLQLERLANGGLRSAHG